MTDYRTALDAMTTRIATTKAQVTEGFPHFGDCRTGNWTTSPRGDWTGGFWVGLLWLAYQRTGEEAYREDARQWAQRLHPRAGSDTVFRGFLFYYGAALGALLAEDETARRIAVDGGLALASAYRPAIKAIPLGSEAEEASDVGESELNIDGVPATALLAWVAEQTDDPSTRALAAEHAVRHIELCVRDDGSICQSASVDPTTGRLRRRYTHKGITDDSTWARAQAWGMVGYALSARWFRERADLLDTAVRAADWWCDHLPQDGVAYWDFDAPAGPGTARDTSATTIAAAALLKLAALVADAHRAARYRDTARSSVDTLVEQYLTPVDGRDGRPPGILTHGCYNHRIGLATNNELIWGSYYLYEALLVLDGALEATVS